jgi:hypothetical protein
MRMDDSGKDEDRMMPPKRRARQCRAAREHLVKNEDTTRLALLR